MRENYSTPIASIERLPRFTTMNVIDGQAGLAIYASLIFYSLTIDNILNIIVLLILAGVSISMISSQDGILKKATSAKDAQKTAQDKESSQMAAMENMMEYETIETVTRNNASDDISKITATEVTKMTKYVDNTSTVNKEAIIPRGFKV